MTSPWDPIFETFDWSEEVKFNMRSMFQTSSTTPIDLVYYDEQMIKDWIEVNIPDVHRSAYGFKFRVLVNRIKNSGIQEPESRRAYLERSAVQHIITTAPSDLTSEFYSELNRTVQEFIKAHDWSHEALREMLSDSARLSRVFGQKKPFVTLRHKQTMERFGNSSAFVQIAENNDYYAFQFVYQLALQDTTASNSEQGWSNVYYQLIGWPMEQYAMEMNAKFKISQNKSYAKAADLSIFSSSDAKSIINDEYCYSATVSEHADLKNYLKRPDFLLTDAFSRILLKGEEKYKDLFIQISEGELTLKTVYLNKLHYANIPMMIGYAAAGNLVKLYALIIDNGHISSQNQYLLSTYNLGHIVDKLRLVNTMFFLAAYIDQMSLSNMPKSDFYEMFKVHERPTCRWEIGNDCIVKIAKIISESTDLEALRSFYRTMRSTPFESTIDVVYVSPKLLGNTRAIKSYHVVTKPVCNDRALEHIKRQINTEKNLTELYLLVLTVVKFLKDIHQQHYIYTDLRWGNIVVDTDSKCSAKRYRIIDFESIKQCVHPNTCQNICHLDKDGVHLMPRCDFNKLAGMVKELADANDGPFAKDLHSLITQINTLDCDTIINYLNQFFNNI